MSVNIAFAQINFTKLGKDTGKYSICIPEGDLDDWRLWPTKHWSNETAEAGVEEFISTESDYAKCTSGILKILGGDCRNKKCESSEYVFTIFFISNFQFLRCQPLHFRTGSVRGDRVTSASWVHHENPEQLTVPVPAHPRDLEKSCKMTFHVTITEVEKWS